MVLMRSPDFHGWTLLCLPGAAPLLTRQHHISPDNTTALHWWSPVVKTTLCAGFSKTPHPFQDKNPPEREFTSVQVTSDYPKHIAVSRLLPWHCNTHFQHPSKTSPFVSDKVLPTEVTTSTQDCCNSQPLKSPGYSLASSHHYFDLLSHSKDELGEDDGCCKLDGCCSAHRGSRYFPNVPDCP